MTLRKEIDNINDGDFETHAYASGYNQACDDIKERLEKLHILTINPNAVEERVNKEVNNLIGELDANS